MFGYQHPAELVGKNINCLVPPPFSKNHVRHDATMQLHTDMSKRGDATTRSGASAVQASCMGVFVYMKWLQNNYVRAFIETGVSKVLNNISEVVATHKDGYVIPVKVRG